MKEKHFDKHHKVVLVGDMSVGKTQLINRFTKNKFVKGAGSTVGIEIASRSMSVKGVSVHVQIWDTCGQEQYRCISAPYFREALGALAVYDITNRKSFLSLPTWIKEIRERGAPNISIIIVGNKSDLEDRREVTSEEALVFAQVQRTDCIETSALSDLNVTEAFSQLMEKVCTRAVLGESKDSITLRSVQARSRRSCKC